MKELYEYNHSLEKEYDSKILTNQRVLIGPAYFQARHLPKEIKIIANEKIEKLLEYQWLDQDDVQNIKDCQEMLNKDAGDEEWNRFKTMTRIQDEYRKTHLSKYDNALSDFVYN